jgi:hypothetical protein
MTVPLTQNQALNSMFKVATGARSSSIVIPGTDEDSCRRTSSLAAPVQFVQRCVIPRKFRCEFQKAPSEKSAFTCLFQ